jgi:Flp pilus assembly protein TadG
MIGRFWVRGSSLPETALVMSILLALLFAIIDFALAVYVYSSITNVARQGARWAMVRGADSCAYSNDTLASCDASESTVQSYVQSLLIGPANPANATVTATWPSCTVVRNGAVNAPGCIVEVSVAYSFKLLPFVSHLSIPMSSSSQMVISQ